jgi:hypothetical protein
MDLFFRTDLLELLATHRSPCVSLFARTTRGGGNEDLIRWKNLLRSAEEKLEASGQRSSEARELLGPARELLDDPPFWLNVSEGVAGFLAPDVTRFYRLPIVFKDEVEVGNVFLVKPLLPLLSGDGAFFVLVLEDQAFRLLLGSDHTIHQIDLSPRENSGSKKDTLRNLGTWVNDTREGRADYFRRLDRGINQLLHDEMAPLVLAGPPEILGEYREVNTYPHLLPEGVECQPDQVSTRQLHDRAWPVVQQHFREARERMAAMYRKEIGMNGPASGNAAEIVSAAIQGHVQYLLLSRNLQLWGVISPDGQQAFVHANQQPGDQDLVNLAVAHTLKHKGTIYLFEPGEAEDLPELAAIFWLPLGQRSSKRTISSGTESR